MNVRKNSDLMLALIDLRRYVKKQLDWYYLDFEENELSKFSLMQSVMRYQVLNDVIHHIHHYGVEHALQLVAPVMVDLEKAKSNPQLTNDSIFRSRIEKLERIYRDNGFVGKHSDYNIPIQVH